ncbi:MAG: hypothetical protein J0L53_19250 [Spirochaetes bacterium]|nr:hypothetical protein [Spirochaetota bacterium]
MPRYTHEVKERAFRIYYETRNLSEVVRVLKRDFPKISKATVHQWAEEKDARDLNWYERSKRNEAAHHEKIDETIAGERRKIIGEAQAFKGRLYDLMPALEAKTLEGAVFAFEKISKFILEQSGSDRDSEQTARESVGALILVLRDDPELGPIIDRRWDAIEEKFHEVLKKIRKAEAKK